MNPSAEPRRLSPMRSAIARRMTQSKQQAPHFYLSIEVEMDALLDELDRRNVSRSRERRLTVTAFLVTALARTLVAHPSFNAVWRDEAPELLKSVNVGVAIALDDGLMAPALLDCQLLGVEEVGEVMADLIARTRAGKLRSRELFGGTFTLSNLGMFRVSSFTAIITPPQVAILAAGRTVPRAVVREGQVVERRILELTLSSDHRAVDGTEAARFLETLIDHLEAPGDWLSAPTPPAPHALDHADAAAGPDRPTD